MTYRITKNGEAFKYEDGEDSLSWADVRGMDISPEEEARLLEALDDMAALQAPRVTYSLGTDLWRVEAVSSNIKSALAGKGE